MRNVCVSQCVCVFGCTQPKHSFNSNLTELDTISVWFIMPANPTSDSPHPASHVAAVIAQKRVLYCICNYTGRPALFELWISNSLCVSLKKGGTKAARGITHKLCTKWAFSLFLCVCCLLLKFDRHLGDREERKWRKRQEFSPGNSIPPAPIALLPPCLSDV